jgi:putative heme-binding domain-containing protein
VQKFAATAFALLADQWLAAPPTAQAQHATAYDIEDGGRRYDTACATCHGPDGDLIAGIDFGRGVFRRPFTDDEMAAVIVSGIPNTPMPGTSMSQEQALRVVAYLRSMGSAPESVEAGSEQRGRGLFVGKGGCTECHRVDGVGSPMGPDLSRIGLVRRAAEIEASLLEPGAEVQPTNRSYEVVPRSGATVTGRLLNHDTFSVQLIDDDGRLRSFAKADVRRHGFKESPMPSVRDKLSADEIADVVAYLVSLQGITAQ